MRRLVLTATLMLLPSAAVADRSTRLERRHLRAASEAVIRDLFECSTACLAAHQRAAWTVVARAVDAYSRRYGVDTATAQLRLGRAFFSGPWKAAVRAKVVELLDASDGPLEGKQVRRQAEIAAGAAVFRETHRSLGSDDALQRRLDDRVKAEIGRLVVEGRQFEARVRVVLAQQEQPPTAKAEKKIRQEIAWAKIRAFMAKHGRGARALGATWEYELCRALGWVEQGRQSAVGPELAQQLKVVFGWDRDSTIERLGELLVDGRGALALATIRAAERLVDRGSPTTAEQQRALKHAIDDLAKGVGWGCFQSVDGGERLAERLGIDVQRLRRRIGRLVVAGDLLSALVYKQAAEIARGPVVFRGISLDRDPYRFSRQSSSPSTEDKPPEQTVEESTPAPTAKPVGATKPGRPFPALPSGPFPLGKRRKTREVGSQGALLFDLPSPQGNKITLAAKTPVGVWQTFERGRLVDWALVTDGAGTWGWVRTASLVGGDQLPFLMLHPMALHQKPPVGRLAAGAIKILDRSRLSPSWLKVERIGTQPPQVGWVYLPIPPKQGAAVKKDLLLWGDAPNTAYNLKFEFVRIDYDNTHGAAVKVRTTGGGQTPGQIRHSVGWVDAEHIAPCTP